MDAVVERRRMRSCEEAAAAVESPAPRWSREALVAGLRDLAARLGRVPVASDLYRHAPESPSLIAYLRVFGSWNAALKAAGFEPSRRGRPPGQWTHDRCLEALREAARVLGHRPTRPEYERLRAGGMALPCCLTLVLRFESWSAALARAGLDSTRARRLPRFRTPALRDLVAELRFGPDGAEWVRAVAGDRALRFLQAYLEEGTLEAAGARFGVSRQRVWQVISRAARRWSQFREGLLSQPPRTEALARLALAVIEDPNASAVQLAEAAWGPGISPQAAQARVCRALRQLRSGVEVPGIDASRLARALLLRRPGPKPSRRPARAG